MEPWICLGDFNVSLNIIERYSKTLPNFSDIEDFSNYLHDIGLSDIHYTGPLFTWTNNQLRNDGVWVKLDRALANECFTLQFKNVRIKFLDLGISDRI